MSVFAFDESLHGHPPVNPNNESIIKYAIDSEIGDCHFLTYENRERIERLLLAPSRNLPRRMERPQTPHRSHSYSDREHPVSAALKDFAGTMDVQPGCDGIAAKAFKRMKAL